MSFDQWASTLPGQFCIVVAVCGLGIAAINFWVKYAEPGETPEGETE